MSVVWVSELDFWVVVRKVVPSYVPGSFRPHLRCRCYG